MTEVDMTIAIKKDTIVVCESGHYICKTNRDVRIGDVVDVKLFYQYGEAHLVPIETDPLCRIGCGVCSDAWLSTDETGNMFIHTKEGWI